MSMFFQVLHGHDLPVYDQLVRQVKFAVASGVLTPGELIPSVRELARQLAINPNTVARAYRQLRDEMVVEVVPGTGLQVARGAARRCRSERTRLIRERLRQVLQEAHRSQLEVVEVQQMITDEIEAVFGKRSRARRQA